MWQSSGARKFAIFRIDTFKSILTIMGHLLLAHIVPDVKPVPAFHFNARFSEYFTVYSLSGVLSGGTDFGTLCPRFSVVPVNRVWIVNYFLHFLILFQSILKRRNTGIPKIVR